MAHLVKTKQTLTDELPTRRGVKSQKKSESEFATTNESPPAPQSVIVLSLSVFAVCLCLVNVAVTPFAIRDPCLIIETQGKMKGISSGYLDIQDVFAMICTLHGNECRNNIMSLDRQVHA